LGIESKKFKNFINLLLEWNSIHNLTGAKTRYDIENNIMDSIYPFKYIDMPKRVLDIGTGAGFPALVLAIKYPDRDFTLCEPKNKRASFLKFASLELGLDNVTIIKKRVEDYNSPPFELITSRAVNNTETLLNITKHLRDKNTRYLLYKGGRVIEELQKIKDNLIFDIIEYNRRKYLYIERLINDI